MSEMVVIYKVASDIANSALDTLRRQGLHPHKVESSGPGEYAVGGLTEPCYRRVRLREMVHIAVPREEADRAAMFLRIWEQQSQDNVRRLTDTLRGQFLLATAVAVVTACILLLLSVGGGIVVSALPVVWFVTFAVVANLDRIARPLGRNNGESSEGGKAARE